MATERHVCHMTMEYRKGNGKVYTKCSARAHIGLY